MACCHIFNSNLPQKDILMPENKFLILGDILISKDEIESIHKLEKGPSIIIKVTYKKKDNLPQQSLIIDYKDRFAWKDDYSDATVQLQENDKILKLMETVRKWNHILRMRLSSLEEKQTQADKNNIKLTKEIRKLIKEITKKGK